MTRAKCCGGLLALKVHQQYKLKAANSLHKIKSYVIIETKIHSKQYISDIKMRMKMVAGWPGGSWFILTMRL